MAADLTATFGMDTSEFKRGIDEVSGIARQGAKEAGHAGGEEAAHGWGDGLKHGGHAVTSAARGIHHLIFAPAMMAGIAYEAFEFGEKIGDAMLVGFGRAGTKAMEDMEKRVEETRKRIEAAQGKRIEEANKLSGRPPVDAEAMAESRKELAEVERLIAQGTANRQYQSAEGPNREAFDETMHELEARRSRLATEIGEITARNNAVIAEHEAQEKRKEEIRGVAEEYKNAHEMMADAVRQAWEEEKPLLAAEHEAMERRERDVERYIRANNEDNDDAALRFRQQENELRQEAEIRRNMGSALLSESPGASTVRSSSISAGGFNSSLGGGIFGVGTASSPAVTEQAKTNLKLIEIKRTLDLIERNGRLGAQATYA